MRDYLRSARQAVRRVLDRGSDSDSPPSSTSAPQPLSPQACSKRLPRLREHGRIIAIAAVVVLIPTAVAVATVGHDTPNDAVAPPTRPPSALQTDQPESVDQPPAIADPPPSSTEEADPRFTELTTPEPPPVASLPDDPMTSLDGSVESPGSPGEEEDPAMTRWVPGADPPPAETLEYAVTTPSKGTVRSLATRSSISGTPPTSSLTVTTSPTSESTAPTSSSAPPTVSVSGTARIDTPAPDAMVPLLTTVTGTATLANGTALWILVRPPDLAYYFTKKAPVVVQTDGTWTTMVGIGRDERDVGVGFDIVPVLTPAADSQFAIWVKDHPKPGAVPFLPPDATVLDGVRVTLEG